MGLPGDYALTVEDLFRLFLTTLGVRRGFAAKLGYKVVSAESIDEICARRAKSY